MNNWEAMLSVYSVAVGMHECSVCERPAVTRTPVHILEPCCFSACRVKKEKDKWCWGRGLRRFVQMDSRVGLGKLCWHNVEHSGSQTNVGTMALFRTQFEILTCHYNSQKNCIYCISCVITSLIPRLSYTVLYSMWQKAGEEPGNEASYYNYTTVWLGSKVNY